MSTKYSLENSESLGHMLSTMGKIEANPVDALVWWYTWPCMKHSASKSQFVYEIDIIAMIRQ